jgi:calcium-dependent protein kinase
MYSLGEVIGEGSFGKVRLVINKQNQKQYAIKILEKADSQGQPRESLLQNEIDILSDVSHPNILKIFELLQDDLHYFIVCEYIEGGQLFEYMQTKYLKRQQQESSKLSSIDASFESSSSCYLGKLSEREARVIGQQLFCALAYLHEKNVVHRDVKPENILLRHCGPKKLQIKLIDFGFAAYCHCCVSTETEDSEKRHHSQHNNANCKSTKLTEVLGSPLYMAPEIVKKQSYDHKVDVWSAGVVIYAMLSGRLPFFGNRKEQVYASICNDEVPLDSSGWQNKSDEVKDFIRLALAK